MTPLSYPEHLFSVETLERLIGLLLEKERIRKSVEGRHFGNRVMFQEEARVLLEKIAHISLKVLKIEDVPAEHPRLVLTRQLSQLPRQTLKAYLFLVPLSLILHYVVVKQPMENSIKFVACGAILILWMIPLAIHRRIRLNIEHQCSYVRNEKGQAAIVIDQLPSIQFQSYLAHEYAHHLYFSLNEQSKETRHREGWARLVQWRVMKRLYRLEGDSAYLHHVLVQIIGELKFACQFIAMNLHVKLPLRVRRIRTFYDPNPLRNLVTGTPGFDEASLLTHAMETAICFLDHQETETEMLEPV